VQILLEAFSGMVTALRFGSESYAAGDMRKATGAFEDALQLYSSIGNARGIGIAHNNREEQTAGIHAST
jgi:hypothetical protein